MRLFVDCFVRVANLKFFWKLKRTILSLQRVQNTGIHKLLYYGLNNQIIVHSLKYQPLMQGILLCLLHMLKNLSPILLNSDDEIE